MSALASFRALLTYDVVRRAVLAQTDEVGRPYVWFTKPDDMNVVVVRFNEGGRTGQSLQDDSFNDFKVWAWVDSNGAEHCEVFACTSESGLKYLRKKLGVITVGGRRIARTAILLPQQVRGMWDWRTARGHKGYEAGRQVVPALFAADVDRDDYLDLNYTVRPDGSVRVIDPALVFRANILANSHRASQWTVLPRILGNSAACVVTQDPRDFERGKALVARQIRAGHGSRTTMTLLTRTAVVVAARRRAA